MSKKKWSWKIYFRRRWKRVLWALAMILCLGQILLLSNEVLRGLNNFSMAPSDDIRWNLSQVEVELLRFENAVHQAQGVGPPDLRQVRTRFDIFYGRLDTLKASDIYAPLRDVPEAMEKLTAAQKFLDEVVVYIDGPDEDLVASLDGIERRIERLLPEVRALALSGIPLFAENSDRRRAEIFTTLRELALTGIALVAGLLLSLFAVQSLYRQLRRSARESDAARSRFEAAVTSSIDAVLVVDTEGSIVEFNGGAEHIFGYSRDEAIGASMSELIVPPEFREAHAAGMARYLETRKPKLVGNGRIRIKAMRRSGEIFPIELAISNADTGRREVFVAYIRDITAELAAEAELREARDKAQAGEKAKSQLLTVMSHEMRTPLNGILGSLELVRGDNLTERQLKLLKAIGVSGELLLSHVNNVLDLSRLDSQQTVNRREDFELIDLVDNLVESMRSYASERRVKLRTDFRDLPPGMVHADKRALQQCLVNLIGNAIKFTRDGSVAVEVEKLPEGEMFEFRVSDTGVGISADDLGRIFDEFMTVDTAYARENPGTGLGLPITRRLIHMLGGEIEVESIEGEGSIFTMRLPLTAKVVTPAPSPTDGQTAQPDTGPSLHVLIVEDNEVNRMILEHMLGDLGCSFESAESGDGGIELARNGLFDLLLLDISMPGKDGLQTLAEIRDLDVPSSRAPAIAITAHAGQEDRDRILGKFDDILLKPITQARLRQKLTGYSRHTPPPADDPAGDFIARFGQTAYDEQLAALAQQLSGLLGELGDAAELGQAHRAMAHKIAGTAAVLGQPNLREALQRIELLPADDWPRKHPELLRDLADFQSRIDRANA